MTAKSKNIFGVISKTTFSWLIVSLVCLQESAFSQQFSLAITELQKIQNSYSDSGYNSFKITYQYAKSSAPGKILDTLSFYYKIKGNSFYCKVDKIEFLQNDSINVAVYHNEKTIILSNPSVTTDKGIMAIDNWDSAFVASNIDSVYLTENNNTRTLKFHFTPESKYSQCSITYSGKTYRPQKISYTETASQYYEEGSNKPEGIIITMHFSGINKSVFDESVFSENKFITTQDNKRTLSSNYKGYRIVNNVFKTD